LIVHFRNVSLPLPQFAETYLDNSYMDIRQVMKVLVAMGYHGTVTLDHTPIFVGEYANGASPAYGSPISWLCCAVPAKGRFRLAYRLIQVGLGDFGKRWRDVVLASPDWEYAGLVTRNEQVLREWGVQCQLDDQCLFPDLAGALAHVEAEAVLVTTPYFKHAEQVLLALREGRHVLVEKPLCDSLHDAYAVREAVRSSGKTLMVSENYRFRPGPVTVRDLVQRGEIGSPELICVQYFVGH
jgi:hypothetical protein